MKEYENVPDHIRIIDNLRDYDRQTAHVTQWTREDVDRAKELISEGFSLVAIAEKFGCTPGKIQAKMQRLRKAAERPPKPTPWFREPSSRIILERCARREVNVPDTHKQILSLGHKKGFEAVRWQVAKIREEWE
jgi:hypothetical protein